MTENNKLDSISATSFIEEAYRIYGRYTNNYRHIPYIYSGLKPVYQRIILASLKEKGFTKTITVSANTIKYYHPHGSCLRYNTKIMDVDGNVYEIGELADKNPEIELKVLTIDNNGKLSTGIAKHFRKGKYTDTYVKININDKYFVEATDNHQFHINYGGRRQWSKAINLKGGVSLVGANKPVFEEYQVSSGLTVFNTEIIKLPTPEYFYDFTVDEFQSMLIPISDDCKKLINVHNSSIDGAQAAMVKAGLLDGQGNFGAYSIIGEDIEPAASRYTSTKLKDEYRKLIEPVLPYVPVYENEYGYMEQEYIPVPIPLVMTFGGLGIGIGTGFKSSGFTPQSLLDAYKSDDPSKLKSSYGNEILPGSQLDKLWEKGTGCIKYTLKVDRDGDTTYVSGRVDEFKPIFDALLWYKDDGRVIVNNLSDKLPRVSFTKVKRVHVPDGNEIYELAKKSAIGSVVNYLRVNYNNCVYNIGLRDWIDICYKNYLNLLSLRSSDQINKLNFEILICENFRKVADMIINGTDSYEDISKKLGIDKSVVDTISKKSIGTLRSSDPAKNIDSLKNKIEEINKFNPESYISGLINNI